MTLSEKFFTIIAGRKEPVQVEYGTLNKATGMPNPNAQKGSIALGKILVLNYARVWGKRIAEPSDAKVKIEKDAKVAVTDPHYKGKIEFLEWGAAGGEVIEVRFLPHSNTLDKQYQDTVQKLRIDDERDIYIKLEQGLNDFDRVTQPLLVQMLEVHTDNADSTSRDPMVQSYDYQNYSPSSRVEKREKAIVARNEANAIVLGTKNDELAIAVLARLFGENPRLQSEVLYENLLEKAETDSLTFLDVVATYRNGLYLTLRDAVEAELITLDAGTVLLNGTGAPKKLVDELDAETEEEYFTELVTKALTPVVYGAHDAIRAALNEYTKQRLS